MDRLTPDETFKSSNDDLGISQANTSKMHSSVVYVGAAIMIFILGGIVGMLVDPYLSASMSNTKKGEMVGEMAGRALGYKVGFGERQALDNSKKALENTMPRDDKKTSISGTVSGIEATKIIFKTVLINSSDDPSLATRTAFINASTSVVLISTSTIVAQEQAGIADGSTQKPFTFEKSSPSEIIVGDAVNIFATKGVEGEKEITALVIQILRIE